MSALIDGSIVADPGPSRGFNFTFWEESLTSGAGVGDSLATTGCNLMINRSKERISDLLLCDPGPQSPSVPVLSLIYFHILTWATKIDIPYPGSTVMESNTLILAYNIDTTDDLVR